MPGQGVVGDAEPGHQVLTEQGADDLREVWRNPLIDRDQAFIKIEINLENLISLIQGMISLRY